MGKGFPIHALGRVERFTPPSKEFSQRKVLILSGRSWLRPVYRHPGEAIGGLPETDYDITIKQLLSGVILMKKDGKTVYIVGAGASAEVSLPIGADLKDQIKSLINIRFDMFGRLESGDELIRRALESQIRKDKGKDGELNDYLKDVPHICASLQHAQSIDTYIDSHRGKPRYATIGKLAITRAILYAERHSAMYDLDTGRALPDHLLSLDGTWFHHFFTTLITGCNYDDLTERLRSTSFVVFNYDRCIEHYIYHALQNMFDIPPESAGELINELRIYHPYGVVGSLPWQASSGAIEYGGEPSPDQLAELALGIKTFSESTDKDTTTVDAIHHDLLDCRKLVFLGFAFNSVNMALLKKGRTPKAKRIPACYATAYKRSDIDRQDIEQDINNLIGAKFTTHLVDMECHELFAECSRGLQFET